MNIGKLSKSTGVNARLIRHYEAIGLIPKASRTEAGYRVYGASDVQFLKFVKRARGLGFSMKEIKKLVSLWRNRTRISKEVKALALKHIDDLETKARDMQEMAASLRQLARTCRGDHRPDCPIIKSLENEGARE